MRKDMTTLDIMYYMVIGVFIFFIIVMSVILYKDLKVDERIEDCDKIKTCENHLCKIEAYEEYGNRKDDILIEQNNYIICKGDRK